MKKAMKVFMLVTCLVCIAACSASCTVKNDTATRITGGGASYSVSDYVDPETGVHYLLYKNGYSGGICPRYNADGTLMVSVNYTDR